MRAVIPIAEQLDRARRELAGDDPLNGRIALIQVDNALELVCHQKAADILERDRANRTLTPEQRADARGRAFDRKIGFLRDRGHIPADQVRAITIFHGYRNQLYHVGLRDDPIVGGLARRYLQLTLALIVPLLGAERHLRWEPTLTSERAIRLLPELATSRRYSARVNVAALVARLAPVDRSDAPTLPAALRDQLLSLVDQSEKDFEFISKGRSGSDDPLATLVRIQLEEETLAKLVQVRRDQDKELKAAGQSTKPLDESLLSMARGHPFLVELNGRLLPGWKPRIKTLPFDSWRKQARTLGAKADDLLALDAFAGLRRDVDYLDEVMSEPVYDMHGWHQHLEDEAMDRR